MRLSWNEIRARAATFADDWQDAAYEKGIMWKSAGVGGGEHKRPICRELIADNKRDAGANPCL